MEETGGGGGAGKDHKDIKHSCSSSFVVEAFVVCLYAGAKVRFLKQLFVETVS